MKVIKTFLKLLLSIAIWITICFPRAIIITIVIVETFLRILKNTLTYLIEQIKSEVLK